MNEIKAPNSKRRKTSDFQIDDEGILTGQRCFTCNILKDVAQFSKNSCYKTGLSSKCKSCMSVVNATQRAAPAALVRNMITGGDAADRNKKRDMKYGTDLNYDWFMRQYTQGCSWSGLPMQMKPFSWDKVSIDRIDDSLRHCQENCRLTLLALNVTRKWDDALMAHCMDAYLYPPEPLTKEEAIKMCEQPAAVKRTRSTDIISDVEGNLYCPWCDSYQDKTRFAKKSRKSGCASCRTAVIKAQSEKHVHSVLQNILGNIRKAIKKTPRKQGDITLANLKALYIEQRGICSVSGVRLALTGHFKISPDRISSRGVYTADNITLVGACFNIADHSTQNQDTTADSQGLTAARWATIMESMKEKKRAEWRSGILGV